MKIRRLILRFLDNWPIKILALAAASLLFLLNSIVGLEERYLNVPLSLELPEDLVPNSSYPSSIRVGIRGEPDEIFSIGEEDIRVFVDFRDVTTEGVYRKPVDYRPSEGMQVIDPLEVTFEPVEITVSLEEKLGRSLPVVPQLTGMPPEGFELVDYIVTPNSVVVEGPGSILRPLEQIRTEEIDLSERRENFSVRVRLVRPHPLVRIPGGEVVEIRAVVNERIITRTFQDVPVVLAGLREDLESAVPLPTGVVQIQGRELVVNQVRRDEVLLLVDATDLEEPGTYALATRPSLPRDVFILNYDPRELSVRIVASIEPDGTDASPEAPPADGGTQ